MAELEDVSPHIAQAIETGRHPFAGNPSFPSRAATLGLAREVVTDVLQKIQRYTGVANPDLMQAQVLFSQALGKCFAIEMEHEPELELLAALLIREEFGVTEDQVRFNIRITTDFTFDGVRSTDKKAGDLQSLLEGGDQEVADGDLAAEISKRRVVNALIQGAARKGQYLFHMQEKMLETISPETAKTYGSVMSLNELNYWLISPKLIQMQQQLAMDHGGMAQELLEALQMNAEIVPLEGIPEGIKPQVKRRVVEAGAAGRAGVVKVEYDDPAGQWVLQARGVNLPVLIHEMYKGMVEIVCYHGLPADPVVRGQVLKAADILEHESWDLALGPALWKRVMAAIPLDQHADRFSVLERLTSLPPAKFHALMSGLLSGSKPAAAKVQELLNDKGEFDR